MVQLADVNGNAACIETVVKLDEKMPSFGMFGQRQCLGVMKFRRGEIDLPDHIVKHLERRGCEFIEDRKSSFDRECIKRLVEFEYRNACEKYFGRGCDSSQDDL